jgi:hypothetical protein
MVVLRLCIAMTDLISNGAAETTADAAPLPLSLITGQVISQLACQSTCLSVNLIIASAGAGAADPNPFL